MQNCHSWEAKSFLSNSHCKAIGWGFFPLKYFTQCFYQNGSFFCLISVCSWPRPVLGARTAAVGSNGLNMSTVKDSSLIALVWGLFYALKCGAEPKRPQSTFLSKVRAPNSIPLQEGCLSAFLNQSLSQCFNVLCSCLEMAYIPPSKFPLKKLSLLQCLKNSMSHWKLIPQICVRRDAA